MSRIQNVFKLSCLLFAVLLCAGCGRCVVQGPWCNQNIINQNSVDQDINNNPYYLTSLQRQTACLTLASNVAPAVRWSVSTNIRYWYSNGIMVSGSEVITNIYTNRTALPTDVSNGGWPYQEFRGLNDSARYYGTSCSIIWQ